MDKFDNLSGHVGTVENQVDDLAAKVTMTSENVVGLAARLDDVEATSGDVIAQMAGLKEARVKDEDLSVDQGNGDDLPAGYMPGYCCKE